MDRVQYAQSENVEMTDCEFQSDEELAQHLMKERERALLARDSHADEHARAERVINACDAALQHLHPQQAPPRPF